MNKRAFQKIISNLLFRTNGLAITKDFLEENCPELIEKSQQENKGFTFLYRVLAIPAKGELRDFRENDCTSKSIASCARIAHDMPGLISVGGDMQFLKKDLFRFKVSSDRILLDIDAVMPELEQAAEIYADVSTFDRDDCEISAKRALELYKNNDEREVIADLRGLRYIKRDISHEAFSLALLLDDYRERMTQERSSSFRSGNQNAYDILEDLMTKKDFADFDNWYGSLEKAPVERLRKRKKKKIAAKIDGSQPAF